MAANALDQLEYAILSLSPGEKGRVLQWLTRDLGNYFPGIDQTPGVAGGAACIVRTRIPVWVLVSLQRQGVSEAELLIQYPTLRAEDLATAWAYARIHSEEIDQAIRENEILELDDMDE